MKFIKKFLLKFATVAALVLSVVFTLTGCAPSTDWVRRTIEQNYYCFNEEDYASLGNMRGLTIAEMMSRLDRYSAYYTKEQYAAIIADNSGEKSGIGVSYSYYNGKGVVLRSVVGNSPARKSGLKAGDIIVAATANGETVQLASSNDFTNFVSARATDEDFTLTLKDGASVTLAKEEYVASYVCMYTGDTTYEIEYTEGNGEVVSYNGGIPELPEGAAYIYLSQFYGNAPNEMGALIKVFNSLKCDTLILDLRDDGGGYVDVMQRIGYRFTAEVEEDAIAMRAIYKSGNEQVDYCYLKPTDLSGEDTIVHKGTKVYAMANDGTASASEALLGLLISYKILDYENIFLSDYRQVAGHENSQPRSYGKGIMQSTFVHSTTKEALKLTVAGIYWADGTTIHGKGLTATHQSTDPKEPDKCSIAPASDNIVNLGMDDELPYVIEKIIADRAAEQ